MSCNLHVTSHCAVKLSIVKRTLGNDYGGGGLDLRAGHMDVLRAARFVPQAWVSPITLLNVLIVTSVWEETQACCALGTGGALLRAILSALYMYNITLDSWY